MLDLRDLFVVRSLQGLVFSAHLGARRVELTPGGLRGVAFTMGSLPGRGGIGVGDGEL